MPITISLCPRLPLQIVCLIWPTVQNLSSHSVYCHTRKRKVENHNLEAGSREHLAFLHEKVLVLQMIRNSLHNTVCLKIYIVWIVQRL